MSDNLSTLASLFGESERRVQLLATEGVIPKPGRSGYDVLNSVRMYIKYLKDEKDIGNAEEIAGFFNVTPAAIYKYQKQGMPRIKRGKYSKKECANWLIAKWRAIAEGTGGKETDDHRKELLMHQSRKAKIEADKLDRTAIPYDEVFADMTAIAGMTVEELSSLAGRLADKLALENDPAIIQEMIMDETRNTRNEIATKVKEYEKSLPKSV